MINVTKKGGLILCITDTEEAVAVHADIIIVAEDQWVVAYMC